LVAIEKIALIDNDFYKSSSSGLKKMHLGMLNAIFIKLVVFIKGCSD
jgi:hypothetical protein